MRWTLFEWLNIPEIANISLYVLGYVKIIFLFHLLSLKGHHLRKRHHRSLPEYHHHSPTVIAINVHHQLDPSPLPITVSHHRSPSQITITAHHHRSPSPLTITGNHHITVQHHRSPTPLIITPPFTMTCNRHITVNNHDTVYNLPSSSRSPSAFSITYPSTITVHQFPYFVYFSFYGR